MFWNKKKFSPQELKDLYVAIKIHTIEVKILANITGKELNAERYQTLVDLSEKMRQMYEDSIKDAGLDPRVLDDSCRGIQALGMFDEQEEGPLN